MGNKRGYNKSKGSKKDIKKWEKLFEEELKEGDFEAFKIQQEAVLKECKKGGKSKKD